jgi:hypothetical protein
MCSFVEEVFKSSELRLNCAHILSCSLRQDLKGSLPILQPGGSDNFGAEFIPGKIPGTPGSNSQQSEAMALGQRGVRDLHKCGVPRNSQ